MVCGMIRKEKVITRVSIQKCDHRLINYNNLIISIACGGCGNMFVLERYEINTKYYILNFKFMEIERPHFGCYLCKQKINLKGVEIKECHICTINKPFILRHIPKNKIYKTITGSERDHTFLTCSCCEEKIRSAQYDGK